MPFFIYDPKFSRQRASDARALAEAITDLIAKVTILEVAVSYQRMAERAEGWIAAVRGPSNVTRMDAREKRARWRGLPDRSAFPDPADVGL